MRFDGALKKLIDDVSLKNRRLRKHIRNPFLFFMRNFFRRHLIDLGEIQKLNFLSSAGVGGDVEISEDLSSLYLLLDSKPTWVELEKNFDFDFLLKGVVQDSEDDVARLILARVEFFDSNGVRIKLDGSEYPYSKSVGYYRYLSFADGLFSCKINMPSFAVKVRLGIQSWAAKGPVFIQNTLLTDFLDEPDDEYLDGVSILMPSYNGVARIVRALTSIINQSFPLDKIQVVVVVNGVDDGTLEKVEAFLASSGVDFICCFEDIASASNARNVAIGMANRKYAIFLDDDDYIGTNYISSMYSLANPRSIILAGLADDFNGDISYENSISATVSSAGEKSNLSIFDVSQAITLIACKLVPIGMLKKVFFDLELKNGEDVVYFSELCVKLNPQYKVVPVEKNNVYFRVLTQSSVSRGDQSFQFMVLDRIRVIEKLLVIMESVSSQYLKDFIFSKIYSQVNFIKRFSSVDSLVVRDAIVKSRACHIIYRAINKGLAKKIVFSYCYPPFVDTAGVVAAKRVSEDKMISDVVMNDMTGKREISSEFYGLSAAYVENHYMVPTPTVFGNWGGVELFAVKAVSLVSGNKYEKMYSRALWPASNFAAFLYKIDNPDVFWEAEFSDPVMWDIEGNRRVAAAGDGFLLEVIHREIAKHHYISLEDDLYYYAELLPYIFADRIVFTCDNQRDYMLSKFPDETLVQRVFEKSVVLPHPQPSSDMYEIVSSNILLDNQVLNYAYFGAFYKTRGLSDVFDAISLLPSLVRNKFKFYIFTSDINEAFSVVSSAGVGDVVVVSSYLGYFEFLNATKKFDCLFVNDASAKDVLGVNPYLPSKLSDYLGSGVPVVAMVEDGSALSKFEGVEYRVPIGDKFALADVFKLSFFRKFGCMSL